MITADRTMHRMELPPDNDPVALVVMDRTHLLRYQQWLHGNGLHLYRVRNDQHPYTYGVGVCDLGLWTWPRTGG